MAQSHQHWNILRIWFLTCLRTASKNLVLILKTCAQSFHLLLGLAFIICTLYLKRPVSQLCSWDKPQKCNEQPKSPHLFNILSDRFLMIFKLKSSPIADICQTAWNKTKLKTFCKNKIKFFNQNVKSSVIWAQSFPGVSCDKFHGIKEFKPSRLTWMIPSMNTSSLIKGFASLWVNTSVMSPKTMNRIGKIAPVMIANTSINQNHYFTEL